RTGTLIASLEIGPAIPPKPDSMASADFSPDGTLVAAAVGQLAKIWDASPLPLRATLQGQSGLIGGPALQPKGPDPVHWAHDGAVKRWKSGGDLVYSVAANTSADPYGRRVISLSFSADGKRFATAGWDSKSAVWDAETGKSISTTRDPQGTPYWVSMSPDG